VAVEVDEHDCKLAAVSLQSTNAQSSSRLRLSMVSGLGSR
jgi:hypothetical protein